MAGFLCLACSARQAFLLLPPGLLETLKAERRSCSSPGDRRPTVPGPVLALRRRSWPNCPAADSLRSRASNASRSASSTRARPMRRARLVKVIEHRGREQTATRIGRTISSSVRSGASSGLSSPARPVIARRAASACRQRPAGMPKARGGRFCRARPRRSSWWRSWMSGRVAPRASILLPAVPCEAAALGLVRVPSREGRQYINCDSTRRQSEEHDAAAGNDRRKYRDGERPVVS